MGYLWCTIYESDIMFKNPKNALKTLFVDTYQREVSVRLYLKGWNLPKKWHNTIDSVIDFVCEKQIQDVKTYVKAQFEYLTKQYCSKNYGIKYPPITVFKTHMAVVSYNRYVLNNSVTLCKHSVNDNSFESILRDNNWSDKMILYCLNNNVDLNELVDLIYDQSSFEIHRFADKCASIGLLTDTDSFLNLIQDRNNVKH
jgi:hypothetical protein